MMPNCMKIDQTEINFYEAVKERFAHLYNTQIYTNIHWIANIFQIKLR